VAVEKLKINYETQKLKPIPNHKLKTITRAMKTQARQRNPEKMYLNSYHHLL